MNLYIFGAGASAAEGVPATKELFVKAWELLGPRFEPPIQSVWQFLSATFQVPVADPADFAQIPDADEVISLVDWCLHSHQGLGPAYDLHRLYQVRRNLEHLVCAVLTASTERRCRRAEGPHARFARTALERWGPEGFACISLNYDTLLDGALAEAGAPPDYGFHELDLRPGRRPLLAKLHGSLHWQHCAACSRTEVGRDRCSRCGNQRLRPMIISPTLLKSYPGAQLQHLWDLALEAVLQAERLVFVGYSMPPGDLPIYHLIRRGLLARQRAAEPTVEVINHRRPTDGALQEAAVRRRFTALFGSGVRFDFRGFHGQV